jgi:hypothetical protein
LQILFLPPALSVGANPFDPPVQNLLDIVKHSERLYSGMEPKPVDDLATAHPTSNGRANRDNLIKYERRATI